MAKVNNMMSAAMQGFNDIPLLRQIALMFGLAASVAFGYMLIMWFQEPNYRPLFGNLDGKDASSVIDVLQQSSIKFKLNNATGTILVPANKIHQARIKLASAGLPKASSVGFDLLEKNSGLGTSRFMENARYVRALEVELGETISSISGVKAARVHLAIPRQSAFINDNKKPSASVMVKLAGGANLERGQVSAIVQMVASSITGLQAKAVTVADQHGQLLTNDSDSDFAKTKEQFNYQKQLQQYYEKRIETMIAPLIGPNKVRVRVAANIDFTQEEKTSEKYNPKERTVRSERTITENNNSTSASGTPGALSNQPPAGGQAGGSNPTKKSTGISRKQTVKNYEIGKSIIYHKSPMGILKNLSVAVVVDDVLRKNPKTGKETLIALTPKEIKKITELVKNAIGFNAGRGDKVSVVNSAFVPPEKIEEPPPLPFYRQPWFWDLSKKGIGVLLALMLLFGLVRPVIKMLAVKAKAKEDEEKAKESDPMTIKQRELMQKLEMLKLKQKHLQQLQELAVQDPSRVASILKNWVGHD